MSLRVSKVLALQDVLTVFRSLARKMLTCEASNVHAGVTSAQYNSRTKLPKHFGYVDASGIGSDIREMFTHVSRQLSSAQMEDRNAVSFRRSNISWKYAKMLEEKDSRIYITMDMKTTYILES